MARRSGLFLIVVALASVALAWAPAPASAQGGSTQYPLTATVDPPDARITQDLGTATFTITAVAQRSGAPLPIPDSVTIQYTVTDQTGQVPTGWTIQIDQESDSAPPGQEVTFEVTVTITSREVAANSVTPSYRIQSQPMIGGSPAPGDPGDQEEVDMTATRALTTTESVTNFADRYKFWLLGGAVALILGAVLLVRRSRSIELSCDDDVQEVAAGRGASFPVKIHNDSPDKDRIQLTTSDVPEGWTVIIPVETIELMPGELDTVWVTVKSPPTARAGERVVVDVFGSSRSSPGREANVALEAVVVDHYSLAYAEPALESSGASSPPRELAVDEPEPFAAPKKSSRKRST